MTEAVAPKKGTGTYKHRNFTVVDLNSPDMKDWWWWVSWRTQEHGSEPMFYVPEGKAKIYFKTHYDRAWTIDIPLVSKNGNKAIYRLTISADKEPPIREYLYSYRDRGDGYYEVKKNYWENDNNSVLDWDILNDHKFITQTFIRHSDAIPTAEWLKIYGKMKENNVVVVENDNIRNLIEENAFADDVSSKVKNSDWLKAVDNNRMALRNYTASDRTKNVLLWRLTEKLDPQVILQVLYSELGIKFAIWEYKDRIKDAVNIAKKLNQGKKDDAFDYVLITKDKTYIDPILAFPNAYLYDVYSDYKKEKGINEENGVAIIPTKDWKTLKKRLEKVKEVVETQIEHKIYDAGMQVATVPVDDNKVKAIIHGTKKAKPVEVALYHRKYHGKKQGEVVLVKKITLPENPKEREKIWEEISALSYNDVVVVGYAVEGKKEKVYHAYRMDKNAPEYKYDGIPLYAKIYGRADGKPIWSSTGFTLGEAFANWQAKQEKLKKERKGRRH
jgi:hypothetical protein